MHSNNSIYGYPDIIWNRTVTPETQVISNAQCTHTNRPLDIVNINIKQSTFNRQYSGRVFAGEINTGLYTTSRTKKILAESTT